MQGRTRLVGGQDRGLERCWATHSQQGQGYGGSRGPMPSAALQLQAPGPSTSTSAPQGLGEALGPLREQPQTRLGAAAERAGAS